MIDSAPVSIGNQASSLLRDVFELPGLRALARPLRRRMFQRAFSGGNAYWGVYDSYAQALASARELSTRDLPASYDLESAGRMYRDQLKQIRIGDYPLVYWLSQLIPAGSHRIFDLGGNIGVSYYGFAPYLQYPEGLQWTVLDMPAVMAVGRKWADQHDAARRLAFAQAAEQAGGCDLLLSSGALQYLDYTLPELLQKLDTKPRHVLVNLTPMHASRSFFTLQNLSIAICPYRVMAVDEFISGMQAQGYRVRDHWQSPERDLRVPFEPDCTVDSYHGFCFER